MLNSSLPSAAPERAAVVCGSCGQVHRFESELMEALHGHRRGVGEQREQAAKKKREDKQQRRQQKKDEAPLPPA